MIRNSSSTSSSEAAPAGRDEPATVRGAAPAVFWTVLALLAADLVVGRVFRPPRKQAVEPSALQRYFEYGRSVEGKLRAMVGTDDASSAPIVRAGWLGNPAPGATLKRTAQPEHLLIASYGQSFTNHVMDGASRLDPRVETRMLAGPAAPLSHSYALYENDRHLHQAQVVVIGVLASALPQLATMTPMTWGFEAPTPYMYPRYRVVGGHLEARAPPLQTLEDLRATLGDPTRWAALRDLLAAEDAAFDPVTFGEDPFDHLTLGRMVRRALGHRHQGTFTARYHDERGFNNQDGILDVARALLQELGRTAAADGRVPVVLLFDDRGYPGHLDAALGRTLDEAHIAYVSSDGIAPAWDESNFVPNGHFTPEVEERLVRLFLARVYQLLPAFRPAATLMHNQAP
jgi:hypothetical protein